MALSPLCANRAIFGIVERRPLSRDSNRRADIAGRSFCAISCRQPTAILYPPSGVSDRAIDLRQEQYGSRARKLSKIRADLATPLGH